MSDRKLAKKLQPLLKQVWKLSRRLNKAMVNWLLRTIFLLNRRPRVAGFVLPTTVFLILVVALTVGALTFRSFNSTTRTIGNVQSREIYNAATPAIDRARAKLDYLFGKDNRLPSGTPSEEVIIGMLLNEVSRPIGLAAIPPKLPILTPANPYKLDDETRIDINGDGLLDNAWIYQEGLADDRKAIVYSINFSTPDDPDPTDNDEQGPVSLLKLDDQQKADGNADGPYVRSGPQSNSSAVKCRTKGGGSKVEGGWFQDVSNTSILRKRFQVDAFVVNQTKLKAGNPVNFTTLEFLQDYKLDRGNKWGAWFKYDLEAVSGAPMNWNGAMHSEGNIFIGRDDGGIFNSFLISATKSCLFKPESNSEISVREFKIDDTLSADDPKQINGKVPFKGIIAAAELGRNTEYKSNQRVDKYNGGTYQQNQIDTGKDWATESKDVIGISTDPVKLLTEDIQQARSADVTNFGAIVNPLTPTEFNPGRFASNPTSNQPYVDDTYRADNRYGPKVRYNKANKIPAGSKVGDNIAGFADLTNDPPTSGILPGLDGYWERRTFKDSDTSSSKVYTGGMRILVGERLELGNPYGWVAPQDRPDTTAQVLTATAITAGDGTFDDLRDKNYASVPVTNANLSKDNSDDPGDPLYPAYATDYAGTPNASRKHEMKQRRALRDNLAAVQASAVYHYGIEDGRTPAACLVTTAHPGSPETLRRSVDFTKIEFKDRAGRTQTLLTDFFYGKGTNGWEFKPPTTAQLQPGQPLGNALANLANFAGDYDPATKVGGAFPPTQDGTIHPDPTLTMWGNFSNLKRAITAGNNSPADQAYLQTAGCTLGALAYNIDQVQKFDTSSTSGNGADLNKLGQEMFKLMDGISTPTNLEVLDPVPATYNPRDYDRVTPDMFLTKLPDALARTAYSAAKQKQLLDMAFLIHEKFQIRRDRTYGFRPSPAANTWNYNPYAVELKNSQITLWSSACDPNTFDVYTPANTLVPTTDPDEGADPIEAALQKLPPTPSDPPRPSLAFSNKQAARRLALSRLCGTVIPPGSVHDFPGDYNYPARNDTSGGITNLPQTSAGALVTEASENNPALKFTDVPSDYGTNKTTFSTAGNPLNTAPYNDATVPLYKRALVAPKFPSLYYIFPEFDHDQTGLDDTATSGVDHRQPGKAGFNLLAAFQPWTEPYIDKTKGLTNSYTPVSATPVAKKSLPPYTANFGASGAFTGAGSLPNLAKFAYTSLPAFPVADTSVADAALDPTPIGDWVLPTSATPAATDPSPNRIIDPDGTIQAIPFQDKVAFNGREWLPARVLDIDLDMLRKSGKNVGNDTWLPVTGLVYAFREDAVREDAIARPAGGIFTDARTPGAETDPPLNAIFNVSTKPVDYIADPDRRPHGFRLRNGAILKRESSSIPNDDNFHGLSFISDQPVYIMGSFNLHQENPGGPRLEEFKVQLPGTPGAYDSGTFYDNRDASDPEPKFADPDQDLWRPSEILADSVSIVSDRFCDGSAIDTFMTAGPRPNANEGGIDENTNSSSNPDAKKIYTNGTKKGAEVYNDTNKALFGSVNGCLNSNAEGATSFLNQNRPQKPLARGWDWVRENPGDSIFSPVKISRNGNGLIAKATSVPVEYSSTNDTDIRGEYMDNKSSSNSGARTLQKIPQNQETGVNVIMVSGVVPAQKFQGYGALSNFPRFLENWDDGRSSLRFSGSFLQLNFSNYATGPFDDDSWEPGETPIPGREVLPYRPPARLWGYDVGLQLAQASPAASRFTTLSNEKNEFYAEPPGSDAYMKNLCLALKNQPPAGFDPNTLNCPT